MRKPVKTLVLITILLYFHGQSNGQLKLPVVVSPLANDVKKVIHDYPARFAHLTGEIIAENPQSTDYACNFRVNGAEESSITRYSSKKEVYSWQAVMLTTENFEKAKQKFKSLYTQLNNLAVEETGMGKFHLKGKYETPREENKYTSVLFSFEPPAGGLEKLKVEISMQYHAPMDWKVNVMVYDREREDNEKGKTVE